MQYNITAPSRLNATVALPASKSISNRALIIHALSGSGTLPQHLSDCDDTEVIVEALARRGELIDIHAAGTAMRFLTAFLSVSADGRSHTLTGTDRMKQRPIGILVDALRYLGASIDYVEQEGYPPLRISGRELEGGRIEVPGNISSQYISALLMIGPVLQRGLELRMTGGIVSRPYIDLTLWMMRQYGADADWSDTETVTVKPQPYADTPYIIESDWSAASYWYEMMALADDEECSVSLVGLTDGSKQGDSVVRYIFSLLGVKSRFVTDPSGKTTRVVLKRQPSYLPRLDYDFVSSPDLAQTVVVTCALRGIPFRFTGLASLHIKETDRIQALKNELRKLGYVLHDEGNDTLLWDGERCTPTLEPIDTYDDHRMAMAFAPVAMKHPGLCIRHPHVVKKSYPEFWSDLRQAGFSIEEEER